MIVELCLDPIKPLDDFIDSLHQIGESVVEPIIEVIEAFILAGRDKEKPDQIGSVTCVNG